MIEILECGRGVRINDVEHQELTANGEEAANAMKEVGRGTWEPAMITGHTLNRSLAGIQEKALTELRADLVLKQIPLQIAIQSTGILIHHVPSGSDINRLR